MHVHLMRARLPMHVHLILLGHPHSHVHLHASAVHAHTCAAHANLHVLTCVSRCVGHLLTCECGSLPMHVHLILLGHRDSSIKPVRHIATVATESSATATLSPDATIRRYRVSLTNRQYCQNCIHPGNVRSRNRPAEFSRSSRDAPSFSSSDDAHSGLAWARRTLV